MRARKALVIGAGIGGLSTALALRNLGLEVQVFEAVKEMKEAGAGLVLWSNAVRGLERLGLADALQTIGMPATYRSIYTWQGELLSLIEVSHLAHGLGAAILMTRRADLQAALLRAFGEANIRLQSRCLGFTQDARSACAHLEGGEEVEGDLLVAADGIHSTLRIQLFGASRLRYAGYATWRGISPLSDEHISIGVSSETWGTGSRIGLIPLTTGVYWFAGKTMGAGERANESAERTKAWLLSLFRGWHQPIEAVIETTEAASIIRADIYELEPLKRWSQGRVTLLGDAAHAMTPNMGQAGCQAIEDAVVLGQCLQEEYNIPTAFHLYEQRRHTRVQRVATQSRRIGQLAHLQHPLACTIRNALVKRLYTPLLSKELDWVLDFEV